MTAQRVARAAPGLDGASAILVLCRRPIELTPATTTRVETSTGTPAKQTKVSSSHEYLRVGSSSGVTSADEERHGGQDAGRDGEDAGPAAAGEADEVGLGGGVAEPERDARLDDGLARAADAGQKRKRVEIGLVVHLF